MGGSILRCVPRIFFGMPHPTITVAEKQNSRDQFLAFYCPRSSWKEKMFCHYWCLIIKDTS